MAKTDSSREAPTAAAGGAKCDAKGRTAFGMCLNWKVIAGLGAVAVGVWAVAPGLIAGVLPLLVFAICPLSMWFMMRGMSGAMGSKGSNAPRSAVSGGSGDLAALKAEHARVAAELEALEREVAQANAGGAESRDAAVAAKREESL